MPTFAEGVLMRACGTKGRRAADTFSALDVRAFEAADWQCVVAALAPVLRRHYPSGDLWLSRRLTDVEAGRAECRLLVEAQHLRGVTIETPKGAGCVKLSTIWVERSCRGAGLGGKLLELCQRGWLAHGIRRAWVTAGVRARPSVRHLILSRGFREIACDQHRYGRERHEWVFAWTPEQHMADCPDDRGQPVAQPSGDVVTPL